jgi:large subunit ribosomal protein L29
MKAKEMRDQTVDELEAAFSDTRKELFKLVNEMQHSKKIEKPDLIRKNKKKLARLLTVLTEKRSAEQNSTL